MIQITLPWPNKALMPNRSNGKHWSVTSAIKKDCRLVGLIFAKQAAKGLKLGQGDIPLRITFHSPDKRRRDSDGLLSAMKPTLDGIADGLGINDVQFEPITLSRKYGGKPGSVMIEIGE